MIGKEKMSSFADKIKAKADEELKTPQKSRGGNSRKSRETIKIKAKLKAKKKR